MKACRRPKTPGGIVQETSVIGELCAVNCVWNLHVRRLWCRCLCVSWTHLHDEWCSRPANEFALLDNLFGNFLDAYSKDQMKRENKSIQSSTWRLLAAERLFTRIFLTDFFLSTTWRLKMKSYSLVCKFGLSYTHQNRKYHGFNILLPCHRRSLRLHSELRLPSPSDPPRWLLAEFFAFPSLPWSFFLQRRR